MIKSIEIVTSIIFINHEQIVQVVFIK